MSPWWHADLHEDHKHARSNEDQKTTILGKILAEEIHETSGKILVGDDRDATARPLAGGPGKTLAEDIRGAAARPTSAKSPPSFPCSCQPSQLGEHLHGDVRPLDRLSKHLHGGMQIFVKTPPPHQLSSLPAYMALHALLAWTRVEAG